MPLYEYECKKCGHRFERLVFLSEVDQKQPCPNCGNKDAGKLPSLFAARHSSASVGVPGGGGFT